LKPYTVETWFICERSAGFPATPQRWSFRQRPARHKRFGEFAGISGVGECKLTVYGEDFLQEILAHAWALANVATL
jgi:hypothetical protein